MDRPVTLRPLLRSESGVPRSEAVRSVVAIAEAAVAAILLHVLGDLNVIVGIIILVEKELGVGIVALQGHGGKGKENRVEDGRRMGISGEELVSRRIEICLVVAF